MSNDKDMFNVVEWCPHCERESRIKWGTGTDGYKAFCPHCGNKLYEALPY